MPKSKLFKIKETPNRKKLASFQRQTDRMPASTQSGLKTWLYTAFKTVLNGTTSKNRLLLYQQNHLCYSCPLEHPPHVSLRSLSMYTACCPLLESLSVLSPSEPDGQNESSEAAKPNLDSMRGKFTALIALKWIQLIHFGNKSNYLQNLNLTKYSILYSS